MIPRHATRFLEHAEDNAAGDGGDDLRRGNGHVVDAEDDAGLVGRCFLFFLLWGYESPVATGFV
jgi:hypothetical protein